ncbi:DUF6193 family natural product biosynthesis protein [Streptomyces sp. NBC_00237]|uniref:DUF6193 family natural product biosynthesis protein n=1 Tax=Streptomyces sp. NBC_00237 TaxID=2975687 RepID=UPI0022583D0D|nr:DUF6193 family natural product biosynthesis protein [Streptomyces sp. NBC_00237]MCX5202940.1 DUF6193 family natural product biosynthesis protein [Streptomyces sp. NBC_00237]
MNSPDDSGTDESRDFDHAYYADLIEQGGLQESVIAVARGLRIDVGPASELPELDVRDWSVAAFQSPRGEMRIILGQDKRRFSISLDSDHRFVWASGSTTDLVEAAEVLHAWKQGVTLQALHSRFPFMEFDRLSLAYEEGNEVETQWEITLGDDSFQAYRELLLKLHAHERFREMFPFFSHWTLGLAKSSRTNEAGEIFIRPSGEGYSLWSHSTPSQKEKFSDIDDLINAAAHLAANL